MKTADYRVRRLPHGKRLTMHWSGCPAGCGNHAAADIGLLGKNVRIDGETVDAVDVFVGGRAGPDAKPGVKVLEDVPCADLPEVLERVIPYLSNKRAGHAAIPVPSSWSTRLPRQIRCQTACRSGRRRRTSCGPVLPPSRTGAAVRSRRTLPTQPPRSA